MRLVCRCCGDEAERISKAGKLVGAFCRDCWRELKYGEVPNVLRHQRNRLGAKARLRHLQDEARACPK